MLKRALLASGIAVAAAISFAPPASAAVTCSGRPATHVGTAANNVINGTAGNDVIHGLGGADRINGNGGNDIICGGEGGDILDGGEGNDALLGNKGNDQLRGGAGYGDDDFEGGPGNDWMIGGGDTSGHYGYDEVVFDKSATPVTADLSTGTATGEGTDTFSEMESLRGSRFNDTLIGDAAHFNYLNGGPGNDALHGEPGGAWFGLDDMLTGGAGDDTLNGGPNSSGQGDTVSYFSSPSAVSVNLATGNATGDGSDTILAVESIYDSAYNDQLVGNSGPNTIRAFAGVDVVHGDAGFDTLSVQDFAAGDFVDGGPDSDSCSYDSGDTVTGC